MGIKIFTLINCTRRALEGILRSTIYYLFNRHPTYYILSPLSIASPFSLSLSSPLIIPPHYPRIPAISTASNVRGRLCTRQTLRPKV